MMCEQKNTRTARVYMRLPQPSSLPRNNLTTTDSKNFKHDRINKSYPKNIMSVSICSIIRMRSTSIRYDRRNTQLLKMQYKIEYRSIIICTRCKCLTSFESASF